MKNYWQRKCKGLPLRRLDSQDRPFTFSKINKCIIKKKKNPHKKEKKKRKYLYERRRDFFR